MFACPYCAQARTLAHTQGQLIETLQQQLGAIKPELDAAKAELEATKAELVATKADLTAARGEGGGMIAMLQQQLAAATAGRGASPSRGPPSCPGRHTLVALRAGGGAPTPCAVCQRPVAPSGLLHGCLTCQPNFVICGPCHSPAALPVGVRPELPEGVPGGAGLPQVKNMDELAAVMEEDKGALLTLSAQELDALLAQECVVTVVGKKRILDEAAAWQKRRDEAAAAQKRRRDEAVAAEKRRQCEAQLGPKRRSCICRTCKCCSCKQTLPCHSDLDYYYVKCCAFSF